MATSLHLQVQGCVNKRGLFFLLPSGRLSHQWHYAEIWPLVVGQQVVRA